MLVMTVRVSRRAVCTGYSLQQNTVLTFALTTRHHREKSHYMRHAVAETFRNHVRKVDLTATDTITSDIVYAGALPGFATYRHVAPKSETCTSLHTKRTSSNEPRGPLLT